MTSKSVEWNPLVENIEKNSRIFMDEFQSYKGIHKLDFDHDV